MSINRFLAVALSAALTVTVASSCGKSNSGSGGGKATIKVTGSDTMVNLAQAWAEEYQKKNPVSIPVKGGGSGVGVAALIGGKVDIATSSRPLEPKEIKLATEKNGQPPKEFKTGLDALAIYVHKKNPIESISVDELRDIYAEGGPIQHWDQLGVDNKACKEGEIIRVSRQNSSGTYAYFKEAVLNKKEYKDGTTAQSGSSDVVKLVANTPCAIGYSGMGYRDDTVKVLKVSPHKGEPGVEPSIATATDGSYPIARPLYIYTSGEPTGAVKEFVDWILSDQGQAIVKKMGYVPLSK